MPKESFLKKYSISQKDFDATKIKWNELQKIYDDYVSNQGLLQGIVTDIVSKFLTNDAKEVGIHSVRSRLKKSDSLIEKIIRKTIEAKKKGVVKNITAKNYTNEINDLIGIRILHVFKNDWFGIHNFILNDCQYKVKESPTAYYRKGDEKTFIDECKKHGCDAKVHPKAYRSIHYIIDPYPQKKIGFAEIQVRTVFEDGWSEIDHKLRYVLKKGTKHPLDSYLLALNRIAGSADEIGTIIRNRQTELRQEEYEKGLNRKKTK
ncbi:MAG: RelA/SpoT domain protein [Bacteroidetes bacterium]|nr:RelA/SpoT domain protein [Bacteroidota bacterium]